MTATEHEVPPTEPTTDSAPAPRRQRSSERHAPEVIPVSKLLPGTKVAEPDESFWYWVGALPHCPLESVHVGGICFPKATESVRANGLETDRVPAAGVVMRLTRVQLRKIADSLPYKVMRIVAHDNNSLVEKRLSEGRPPHTGVVHTIMTEAQYAERQLGQGFVRRYVPLHGDRPLADYIYAQWLEDEISPLPRQVGQTARPLSETGLTIPHAKARAVPHGEKAGSIFGV